MNECIFCTIISRDAPALWLAENERVVAVLSLEGHPMVLTRDHTKDIYELDEANASAIMPMAVRIARATKKALGCDGISLAQANEVAGGQEVFHFHLHVIPRWVGDGRGFKGWKGPAPEQEREDVAEMIRSVLDH